MSGRRHVEDHLTVPEAARRLGVSVKTVTRWIASGRLGPAYRPTRRTVILPARAVISFLDGCRIS